MEKQVRKFNPLDPAGFFSPGPEKKFKEEIERQMKDEIDAGNTYRAMAEHARRLNRVEMANTLMTIATQEDGHYQQLLSMMITLEPGYKGMTRIITI